MQTLDSVDPPALARLRRIVLGVVLFGIVGLAAELVLLEHTEGVWQWAPLVALAVGFASGVAVALRPGRATLRAFQGMMVVFLAAGAAGVYLHMAGNAEFERESDPAIAGAALFRESLYGATPALAPGALAQLGLFGLALAYGHPALRRRAKL